jgi:leader peptidase (prepilin peptidase)/N-methyltransferase
VGLRVPKKQSIIRPPSHCTSCGERLKAVDLIPVFSYLFLKGKCRYCRATVSPLYPLIELITACLFAVAPLTTHSFSELLISWALISLFMIIFVSDVTYMLIPDRVLAVFAVLFLILKLWTVPFGEWGGLFVGAAVGFAVPFFVAVVSRGNMGGGDIKLFALLGFVLGWKGVLVAFFLSTLYGSLIGGIGLLIGKFKRGKPVPFGPFIVFGTLTAYFFGDALLNWYLHLY